MTKVFQAEGVAPQIKELQRRAHALETQQQNTFAVADSTGQLRVVVGLLDILGGVYIGKYGWVVLNAAGGVVASQYA